MNTSIQRLPGLDLLRSWDRFCKWIVSTENRLYIGWFGVLMVLLAGHSRFLGRLLIPWLAIRNHCTFHFLLVALPTLGIWCAALRVGVMAFNLNGFNFNHSLSRSRGALIRTDADLINRANLGIQVLHAPNVHHFPNVLSAGESVPVAMTTGN